MVYNNLSGDTHLLSLAALDVLAALREPADSSAALAASLGLAADAATLEDLDGLLGELQRLALVDRA